MKEMKVKTAVTKGCTQCGNCCIQCDIRWEEITDTNKSVIMDRLRWLQLHRCDTQIMSFENGQKFGLLRIPLTCSALDMGKDGKFFCKIYDTRPQLCKDFLCPRAKRNMGTSENSAEIAAPPQG